MQPENSQPVPLGPEQLPPPALNGERVPVLPKIETGIEKGAEHKEQAAEAGAQVADAASLATPAALPVPVPPPVVADPAQQQPSTTGPMVAADEDVIEKEWIDKAKQIIEQTKDDPHARTVKVNELQRDYLQKRYGKVVGASE